MSGWDPTPRNHAAQRGGAALTERRSAWRRRSSVGRVPGLVAGVVLVGLSASACAYAPARQAAQVGYEIPAAWVADKREPGVGQVAGPWWEAFEDARLTRLIERVLTHNPTIDAAAARILQANANARIAGADGLPNLSASFSPSRNQSVFTGIPTPDGSPLRSLSNSVGISLAVSWELDLWGRVRHARSAMLADVQAAQAANRSLQLSLVAQATKGWFAAVDARLQLELARRTKGYFEQTLSVVNRRFEGGTAGVSSLDVRLTQANVANAAALVALRQSVLARAIRQLETLAGAYPRGDPAVADMLPALPAVPPTGVPTELLARRPDVVEAERRLAATGARATSARRALLPTISFAGSVGYTSDDIDDFFSADFNVWNLAGNLLAPLFQGGRLRAAVDLRDAQQREALANLASVILRAFGEVEQALAVEGALGDREAALVTRLAEQAAAGQIAEERYTRGLVPITTLLDALRQTLDAEGQLLTIRRERLENRVDLFLALGGGLEALHPQVAPPVGEDGEENDRSVEVSVADAEIDRPARSSAGLSDHSDDDDEEDA